jgi:CubicO group peptidase (beta-lactamase class C family)
MLFRTSLIVALILGLCVSSGCQTSPRAVDGVAGDPAGGVAGSQMADAMQQLMQAYHGYHQFNGAVLVAEGGQVVYADSFGAADVEFDVPNTPQTRFRIASITKVFTAVLILQLVDEGTVHLDSPVGEYVSMLRPDIAERVSVGQLLNHTSGLAREYFPASHDDSEAHSMRDLLQAVNENTQFLAEPGERNTYSNAGFVLLAAVIENETGETYEQALQSRIFDPLGLRDSGVEGPAHGVVPGLAQGYRLRLGTYLRAPIIDMSSTRGNGGMYSTVGDLLLFDQGLRAGTLLSPEATTTLFDIAPGSILASLQAATDPAGYPAGVGRLAWARGANPGGFRSQWTREMDGDRSVILLANLDYSPRNEITKGLFAILFGEEPPIPDRPLSDRVLAMMRDAGVDAAATLLNVERSKDENAAGRAVNELVEFGHHAIRAGRPEEAVRVFEVCDGAFPDVAGIVVSLGFAWLEAGEKGRAEEFANKALKLEPGLTDAHEVLDLVRMRH